MEFKEITSVGIAVRSDNNYNLYSSDETMLFDIKKVVIKLRAAEILQQVTGSIGQCYAVG